MDWNNLNHDDSIQAETRRSLHRYLTGPVLRFVSGASPARILTASHRLGGRRRLSGVLIPRSQVGHRHSHAEISVVIEGRCAKGFGGDVFELGPGDWTLHPPHIEHFEAGLASLEPFRQLWFLFLDRRADVTVSKYDAREGWQVEFLFEGVPARFTADPVRLIQRLTADVETERVSSIRSALLDVVHHFVRQIETAPLRRYQGVADPLVREVLEWLDREPAGRWGVQVVAQSAGCSVATLTRRFKRVMGCSFASYLRDRRLGQAQHMLRTSSVTLAAVAERCGFTDDSHLVRVFRARLGCTPGQFREADRLVDESGAAYNPAGPKHPIR